MGASYPLLPREDLNLDYLIQSQVSCRLDDGANSEDSREAPGGCQVPVQNLAWTPGAPIIRPSTSYNPTGEKLFR